jgi:hypothetical protein
MAIGSAPHPGFQLVSPRIDAGRILAVTRPSKPVSLPQPHQMSHPRQAQVVVADGFLDRRAFPDPWRKQSVQIKNPGLADQDLDELRLTLKMILWMGGILS